MAGPEEPRAAVRTSTRARLARTHRSICSSPTTMCLECLFPKAHDEDRAEYANAVKSKTKHLLTGATHYPSFARPKPYVVKDKKTGANPTQSDIDAERLEFWASAPSSGGDRKIWEVLRQASEAMLPKWETRDGTRVKMPGKLGLAHSKVLQHNIKYTGLQHFIVVAKPDMTLCVDSQGFNYVLPKYLLRDPSNLEDHSRGNPTSAIVMARRRAGAVDEEDVDGDSSTGDEGGLEDLDDARKKFAGRRMMSNPLV